MAPGTLTHQTLITNLAFLLTLHLRAQAAGLKALVKPGIVPPVFAERNMRVPDIVVAAAHHEPGQRVLTNPIVIVEVLSPSNEADTRANMWTYMTIPSLRDILVVDSEQVGVELVARQSDGSWPDRPTTAEQGAVMLASIGLMLRLVDIYRDTPLASDAGSP